MCTLCSRAAASVHTLAFVVFTRRTRNSGSEPRTDREGESHRAENGRRALGEIRDMSTDGIAANFVRIV